MQKTMIERDEGLNRRQLLTGMAPLGAGAGLPSGGQGGSLLLRVRHGPPAVDRKPG